MDQITPQLWISDRDTILTSDTSQFDSIITVCQDDVSDNVSVNNPFYPLCDGEPGVRCVLSYRLFEKACDDVLHRIQSGETVLVHCHMGVSRSASVCIATIGVLNNIYRAEARKIVEKSRPQINPHSEFIKYISTYIDSRTDLNHQY